MPSKLAENNFAPARTALYGVVLLAAAIAYLILQRVIIAEHGESSLLATAVGGDLKGKLSLLLYAIAIPAAFLHQWISGGSYVLMALIWLIPDRRIGRALAKQGQREAEQRSPTKAGNARDETNEELPATAVWWRPARGG